MRQSAWLLGTVGMVVGLTALGLAGNFAFKHRHDLGFARDRYEDTARQLAELHVLHDRQPTFIAADKGDEDLTRRVTRSLTAAGLAAAALSNLTPDGDQAASSARTADGKPVYIRRAARLTLEGLTLPQLGKFLEAWRSVEPGWTVSHIDLGLAQGGDGGRIKAPTPTSIPTPTNSHRDMPLHVLLTIESVIAAEPNSTQASS